MAGPIPPSLKYVQYSIYLWTKINSYSSTGGHLADLGQLRARRVELPGDSAFHLNAVLLGVTYSTVRGYYPFILIDTQLHIDNDSNRLLRNTGASALTGLRAQLTVI